MMVTKKSWRSTLSDSIDIGLQWIKDDWHSHRLRFVIELFAWSCSIASSIIIASTIPNAPLPILYPIWIVGCTCYAWASWTRRSFGLLGNYILLVTIDSIGLIRLLLDK